MVTIEWNYVCTITRPLLAQRQCLIDVSSHSSPPVSGSWGRLLSVTLLNSSMHCYKATAGPQGTSLFTSSPTQRHHVFTSSPSFLFPPILVWPPHPAYPSGLPFFPSVPPLLLQEMAVEVLTTLLPSEWVVLGIGMGHSVRGSFHSKHMNYEGIKVWVCGGGEKDV